MHGLKLMLHIFLVCIVTEPVWAGPWYSLGEKVFSADAIVEISIHFNNENLQSVQPIPTHVIEKTVQQVEFIRSISGTPKKELISHLPTFHIFSSNSPCWTAAYFNKTTNVILFLKHSGKKYRQLTGVENGKGFYTSLNPDYKQLVSAIQTVTHWPEERMQAIAPEMLWQTQKELLSSTNNIDNYLRYLTYRFLQSRDSLNSLAINTNRPTEPNQGQNYCKPHNLTRSDKTEILDYTSFGPQAMAYTLIGFNWWQWLPHGDSNPKSHYPIKLVVHRNVAIDSLRKHYPVIPAKQQDYRYIELEKAIRYLNANIAENVMPEITTLLRKTKKKLLSTFGNEL